MCEAKLTKGEWEVKSTSLYPARIKVKDKKGMEGKIIGDIRNRSNADLIAMAPEMYEMLEYVMKCAAMQDNLTIDASEISKLLAKARGEHV